MSSKSGTPDIVAMYSLWEKLSLWYSSWVPSEIYNWIIIDLINDTIYKIVTTNPLEYDKQEFFTGCNRRKGIYKSDIFWTLVLLGFSWTILISKTIWARWNLFNKCRQKISLGLLVVVLKRKFKQWWLSNQDPKKCCSGPSNKHSHQIWSQLTKRFWRRRLRYVYQQCWWTQSDNNTLHDPFRVFVRPNNVTDNCPKSGYFLSGIPYLLNSIFVLKVFKA